MKFYEIFRSIEILIIVLSLLIYLDSVMPDHGNVFEVKVILSNKQKRNII